MKTASALLVVAVLAGCSSGGVYPDTDVVEPTSMKLVVATGLVMSGGLLQSGVLEYDGDGDLNTVFRAYIEGMKTQKWAPAGHEVKGDKATGTLRKDSRTCNLSFTSVNGKIRAVITVTQQK